MRYRGNRTVHARHADMFAGEQLPVAQNVDHDLPLDGAPVSTQLGGVEEARSRCEIVQHGPRIGGHPLPHLVVETHHPLSWNVFPAPQRTCHAILPRRSKVICFAYGDSVLRWEYSTICWDRF